MNLKGVFRRCKFQSIVILPKGVKAIKERLNAQRAAVCGVQGGCVAITLVVTVENRRFPTVTRRNYYKHDSMKTD